MEARRQRITDLALGLLPCIEDCQRKKRMANMIVTVSIVVYALLGGYVFNELNRTINYSEFITLSSVIESSARQKSVPVETLTHAMLSHFQVDALQNLKARYWHDALSYVTANTEK